MEYDTSRRCLPHNPSYPNYIYDRNAPLALSHDTRENPRGYPIGGPVGGMHSRASMEEPMMATGPARRRIAVACARCRKRKIRCSGDPGSGSGCTNCRQAGVELTHCQFHRVGSDVVHKVMDERNMAYSLSGMANTHNMLSVYSTGGNSTLYQRPLSSQQYQQLDSKPMCSSNWTIPYSEDTSPIDTYNLEQSQAYIPQSTAVAHTNMYPPSCRWTQPLTKAMQQGGPYFDQDLHFAHANHRLVTSSDISPLNTGLASLHLSLPERPHPQQPVPLDSGVPQRQLPMPHPSPAQTNRNVVDQMQDARLRSAQATGTSTMDNRGSFAKPLLPWAADSENNTNASQAVPADAFTQAISPSMSDNAESRMGYLPNTTSTADDDAITATTASQLELNFSASSLLDAMSAPAPTSNYSYVRESRQMARPTSQANLYSYSPSSTSKRNSLSGESSSDCVLVSGHRYTPLSHSQSQTLPGNRSLHRESCQSRNVQLHRTSMGNLNSTY